MVHDLWSFSDLLVASIVTYKFRTAKSILLNKQYLNRLQTRKIHFIIFSANLNLFVDEWHSFALESNASND